MWKKTGPLPLGFVCLLICAAVALPGSAQAEPVPENGRSSGSSPGFAAPIKQPNHLPAKSAGPAADDSGRLEEIARDYTIYDDLIVTGSECLGFDCVDGETFDYNTFMLKENNLRIYFWDTSATSNFPTNDWVLIANDSEDGGDEYFALQDLDAATIPFRVEAGAPDQSLYLTTAGNITTAGKIGVGTDNPLAELQTTDGDTPTLRLEQDNSQGWTPQTWDLAGNEANFFIRDVTNGSTLPFRIRPGAPSSSLIIQDSGHVGVGTWSPDVQLHVESADPGLILENTSLGTDPVFHATANGDVIITGHLKEASSREVKDNLLGVDPAQILQQVAALDVYRWNYRTDDPAVTHLGPVAEDFAAHFGLGGGDKHISPSDLAGVALGAIQALHQENQELQARLTALEETLRQLGEQE